MDHGTMNGEHGRLLENYAFSFLPSYLYLHIAILAEQNLITLPRLSVRSCSPSCAFQFAIDSKVPNPATLYHPAFPSPLPCPFGDSSLVFYVYPRFDMHNACFRQMFVRQVLNFNMHVRAVQRTTPVLC